MKIPAQNSSLIESEKKFRLLAENMIDLVALHEPDATYSYVSPSFSKVLGYSEKELIGTSPYDHFHPDDIPQIKEEAHAKALNGEIVRRCEYRIRKKSGEYIWFLTKTMPILNEKKEITQLQTVSSDITERKLTEIKLQESERKLNAAEKIAHIGNYEINLAKGTAVWSEETFNIFGMDPQTDKEPNIEEYNNMIFPEDREKLFNHFAESVSEKKKFNLVYRIIRRDEEIRYVHSLGIIELDSSGEEVMFGTFQDITESKKTEQVLKTSEENLRNLNTTKDRIISIIGHDLKTPLNNIIGFSSLIEKNPKKYPFEKILEFNSIIYQSANSLSTLLNNLLFWAREQSQQLKRSPKKHNMYAIINDCISFLQQVADKKEISFENKAPSRISVFADEEMIKTVIRNLLSNAIKFSANKQFIKITAEKRGGSVVIGIHDKGIGIKQEKIGGLFEINNEKSTQGTDGEKGTGLGLLICKDFVEKNNGKIWVESEWGKGSDFYIMLPAHPVI
jgi:PAS domain S-box-containing protein